MIRAKISISVFKSASGLLIGALAATQAVDAQQSVAGQATAPENCAGPASPSAAFVPSISQVPIGNDKDCNLDPGVSINGTEITMPGGGRRVFFEFRIGDWDPNDTGVQLLAFVVYTDAMGYSTPQNATVKRLALPCTTDAECVATLGEGATCMAQGADVNCTATKCCTGVFINHTRTDLVGVDTRQPLLCSVGLTQEGTRVGCVASAGAIDDPEPFPVTGLYAGTLVVDVPPDAEGMFTAPFLINGGFGTVLKDASGNLITPLETNAAVITIPVGRCCHKVNGVDACVDGISAATCAAFPGPTSFAENETCATASCADCDRNGVPDFEEFDSFFTDCNGNGIPDTCDAIPLPDTPKNRYITILTDDVGPDQAIRVTFTDLAPPFDVLNGLSMWVADPFEVSVNGANPAPVPHFGFMNMASLMCTPLFRDWRSFGFLEVFHEDIVPSSTYTVEIFDNAGVGNDPILAAPPRILTTSRWGDVAGPFDPMTRRPSDPDGSVDIVFDAVAVLDTWTNQPCSAGKARCDIWPATPNNGADVLDLTFVVDAFKSFPYPFKPGPSPCGAP